MTHDTTLRLATRADAAAMLAIYAPFIERTSVSFEEDVPSVETFAARVGAPDGALPWVVAERGGEIVGYAYASPHRGRAAYRWCVEVSVYVAEGYRRGGLARALYTALFALLARQRYVNAYAGIAQPNDTSVAFHESLGFECVALYPRIGFKAGAWHDVGWWALRLDAREAQHAAAEGAGDATPPDPRPLSSLARSEIDAALAAGAARLTPRG